MPANTYNARYREYLLFRGYDPDSSAWSTLKRAVISSWAEPGFFRFWKIWNPGIGYLLYRLYVLLGGKERRALATIMVFLVCGFLHDVIAMAMFRRPFVAFSTSFLCFGILTVLSRWLAPFPQQERWPVVVNTLMNISLVCISVHIGVMTQMTFVS